MEHSYQSQVNPNSEVQSCSSNSRQELDTGRGNGCGRGRGNGCGRGRGIGCGTNQDFGWVEEGDKIHNENAEKDFLNLLVVTEFRNEQHLLWNFFNYFSLMIYFIQ